MTDTLRLPFSFAHPQDQSMGMGGTLAKYAAEGVEAYYVCESRGERSRERFV
jgi:LmbE family N-acetylglucosaminyl deacetylase